MEDDTQNWYSCTSSVEEALKLDEENGNHLWYDAIKKEMAKAAVA